MAGSLFRTKSIERLMADAAASGEGTLKRTLGPFSLVALGIGAIIGAGLFVRTAAAIADRAGPSVTIAFIVAGIGCAFAGLCYAEFASMIPDRRQRLHLLVRDDGRAGRLDHRLGPRARVRGRRRHGRDRLERVRQTACSTGSACASPTSGRTRRSRSMHGSTVHGIMNVPAVFILLLLTLLLIRGTQESAIVNGDHRGHQGQHRAAGDRDRLGLHQPGQPHAPTSPRPRRYTTPQGDHAPLRRASWGSWEPPGSSSSRSSASTPCRPPRRRRRTPKRDMPIGILGSLVICTVLYVLFALRPERRRDGRGLPHERPRGVGRVRDHEVHARLRVAVEVRDGRHPGRLLVGHPRDAARPVARLLSR